MIFYSLLEYERKLIRRQANFTYKNKYQSKEVEPVLDFFNE
jgi:hypothetical protein